MIYRSHRGGCYYTPENTMAAFRHALAEGFEQIETDPVFTKDGQIVLFHDSLINRLCRYPDGSEIRERTYLRDLTYEELLQLDVGLHKGEAFRGERIPRLEELLQLTEGKPVRLALDKKCPIDRMAPIFDLVARYNTEVSFSCMDMERIGVIQNRFPDAHIVYDGPATEQALEEVTKAVDPGHLEVWMYMDKPNFAWLEDTRKASAEKCAVVKKYAKLGIGNVCNPYDVREALSFAPDILEV